MRIISFSNVSAQPFLAIPAQVLTPWITRLKNSLHGLPNSVPAQRAGNKAPQPFVFDTTRECANSSFGTFSEVPLAGKAGANAPAVNALRVVREFDSAISPDCAGRMVISGRMADVCAELDRMALHATHHP